MSSWCQWWPAPFAEAVIVTFWAAGRWSLWDQHGILQYLDIRCWTVHVCSTFQRLNISQPFCGYPCDLPPPSIAIMCSFKHLKILYMIIIYHNQFISVNIQQEKVSNVPFLSRMPWKKPRPEWRFTALDADLLFTKVVPKIGKNMDKWQRLSLGS